MDVAGDLLGHRGVFTHSPVVLVVHRYRYFLKIFSNILSILIIFSSIRQLAAKEVTLVVEREKEVWDVRRFARNVKPSGEHLQKIVIKGIIL